MPFIFIDLLKLAFITLPILVSLNYLEEVGEIILVIDISLER